MRVELRPDLDLVAAKLARRPVDRLAAAVAREAQRRAPDARVWLTVEDERVRPSHALADGQTIPANLRFKLRKVIYRRGGGRGSKIPGQLLLAPSGYDLAREPRDEDLPDNQKKRCRCADVTVPGLIAKKVVWHAAVVEGNRVRAEVSVRFNRIIESEKGTSKDVPARFMGSAIEAVAARLR